MNPIFTPATLVGPENQRIILREVRARAWSNDPGTALDIDPDGLQWETGRVDPVHNLDSTEIDRTEFVVGRDRNGKQRLSWKCSTDPLAWRDLQFDLQTPATVRRRQLDADTMERAKSYLHGGKTGAPPVWETINLA